MLNGEMARESILRIEAQAVEMYRSRAALLAAKWHGGAIAGDHDGGPWRLCETPECTAIATLLDVLEAPDL
jgi:hypothetical protein